jgi:prepilin-type processing-associated H-X9-DG protein
MWANDHEEQFPMARTNDTRSSALDADPLPSFLTISNELNSPKSLLCPQDARRGPRALVFEGLTKRNVSYSIGIDADEINPRGILIADRNIVLPENKELRGLLTITNWKHATWNGEIHQFQGNIAFTDGSACQVTQDGLQKALRDTGLATNRFAVP